MTFKVTQYERSGGIRVGSTLGEFATGRAVIVALQDRSGNIDVEVRSKTTGRMWDFPAFKAYVEAVERSTQKAVLE